MQKKLGLIFIQRTQVLKTDVQLNFSYVRGITGEYRGKFVTFHLTLENLQNSPMIDLVKLFE